jgi:putative transposase
MTKDPVHILFKAQPNSKLSKFISANKSASSRLIKKEYLEIRTSPWKRICLVQNFLSANYRRHPD